MWLLLGLQHHRSSGGPTLQEDGQTGVAERAEPGGLLQARGQRGLQRRSDGPGLPVRQGQPGPGLRGLLPLPGNSTYLMGGRRVQVDTSRPPMALNTVKE